MKKLIILGVSGSIGQQALEIVTQEKSKLQLVAVSVYQNNAVLKQVLQQFPSITHVYSKEKTLQQQFPNVVFVDSPEQLTTALDYDIALNALVGSAGLLPSLSVLKLGKKLALANKESLVIGGELIKDKIDLIVPVDSEHSAIYQCLQGEDKSKIEKIVITCSGGAVRDLSPEESADLTAPAIFNHPTWKMGKKITTDCATLVNKAFEVIEAHYLFDLAPEKIEVVYHPQSIVHGLIYFIDGTIKAVLSGPDMKIAIAYALLGTRTKLASALPLSQLTFFPKEQFGYRLPLLNLGYKALKEKGTFGAVFNAINDVAVAAFINNQLSFSQLCGIIIKNLEYYQVKSCSLDNILKESAKYQQLIKQQILALEGKDGNN